MSKRAVAKSSPNIPGEFKELFGPPALHKAEDEENYNLIICSYVKDFGPMDTITRVLLADLVHYTYEIQWFRRLINKLIREIHKQDLVRRGEKLVAEAQLRIDRARNNYSSVAKQSNVSEVDKAAARQSCEAEVDRIQKEVRQKLEILKQAEEGEIDEAALFRKWLPFYAEVQNRLTELEGKFRATVMLLDEHQQGLGQRLRKISEKIIEVEPEILSAGGETQSTPAEGI